MKLVIDIPEDVYKKTVFYREFRDLNDCVTTIKALENGIPLSESEDCISRKAAIDAIWDGVNMDIYTREVKECLETLPSVNPVEKVGRWIEKDGWDGDVYYECSVCKEPFCLIDGSPTDNMYNYCPNCGAKMQEVEE